jgi:hypothetical protein
MESVGEPGWNLPVLIAAGWNPVSHDEFGAPRGMMKDDDACSISFIK